MGEWLRSALYKHHFLCSHHHYDNISWMRSGQNHPTRHNEMGKHFYLLRRQTKIETGRQHQGMDGPGAWQVPEVSAEQGNGIKRLEKSSVVLLRQSRLRDQWWWWYGNTNSCIPLHSALVYMAAISWYNSYWTDLACNLWVDIWFWF